MERILRQHTSTRQKAGETMQTSSSNKRRSLILRLFFRALFGTLSVLSGLFLIVVIWVRAMHHPWFQERLIQWNKHRLNPITLKGAGHHTSIYALVKHIGRHSGRAYTTPVVAKPLGDGFVIPLPYGTEVDWCRNVLEASTCTLLCNEQEYVVERPELLSLSGTGGAFPLLTRWLYAAGGIKQYLWVHQHRASGDVVPTREAMTLLTSAPPSQ
jgi:hypothetical protein